MLNLCPQIISMVLGVALLLQMAYMPYESGYMNRLEFVSLLTCTITIYFSLYYANPLNDGPLVIITTIVICQNILTVGIFVYALIRTGWHGMLQMLKLSPQVRSPVRHHIQVF